MLTRFDLELFWNYWVVVVLRCMCTGTEIPVHIFTVYKGGGGVIERDKTLPHGIYSVKLHPQVE